MASKQKADEQQGGGKRAKTDEKDAAGGASTASSGTASSTAAEQQSVAANGAPTPIPTDAGQPSVSASVANKSTVAASGASIAIQTAGTAAEHFGRWLWTKRRQVQWFGVTGELWKHERLAIGADGASGGFQGLVNDHDVVYVIGEGSMRMVDHFFGTHHMETRHGVAAMAPWCQMMNEDDYPSYQLVSQKGRFAHALVLIQQAFRTKRFWRALSALRLLPGVSPDILHSIAHLCSGRALQNGIRYPVVGFDKVTGEAHRHFFEPTKPYEPSWNGIPIGRCCDSSESSDPSWSSL
jgi:hypothetical protein